MQILVTGATGYLGKSLVQELLKKNLKVKCLVRKKTNLNKLKKETILYGDLTDKASLDNALKNTDIVIHLAAVTNVLDKNIDKVNIQGTRNLVEACKKNKISRIIFISSTAAVKANDNYGKSKKEAEDIIINSKLNYVILRPSFIYSKNSPNLLNIIKINKKIPFFTPIIGNGKYKINPVHVNDVISAIISVINNKKSKNKLYYVLGPKEIEFNEFIDEINKALNLKRKKLNIPIPICLLIAKILERLVNKPILTISTIKATRNNIFYSIEEAKKDFNYDPIDFKRGILEIKNGI